MNSADLEADGVFEDELLSANLSSANQSSKNKKLSSASSGAVKRRL